ncbi:MAG TPA: secondary thiamine-phosphate synthase enzyme YjbQ [Candidatus Omnitrophota bacterium]|nr:secondary thiamine-phosphate synthase enzyme YjbQ [Candidatus Omnitrophota bacterium]
MMEQIAIHTAKRVEFIDITALVSNALKKTKRADGMCVIFCPHTTAGLTINENADPAVAGDIAVRLSELIPENAGYRHAEGNSDAHIKSSLFGSSVTVIVEKSRLMLGTWQGIYFCESDGPRQREVWVKIIGV